MDTFKANDLVRITRGKMKDFPARYIERHSFVENMCNVRLLNSYSVPIPLREQVFVVSLDQLERINPEDANAL